MDTATDGHLAHLRRLRAAKDAMDRDWADETLNLDTVATHAGYSRSHFVRAFKTAYGQTPGEYRRSKIARGAALIPGCYALLWAGGFHPTRDSNSEEAD
ncbi:helix-turn-helix transcriptional regulator [Streptomyces sp. NPDC002795]|uniref:helix-turn-helix transcriptional regulator n=1 Tax=Streptomyces sp. NPDC002795 TaxID=3364665 RepID=UPI003698E2CD